jgi:hypothetical protein
MSARRDFIPVTWSAIQTVEDESNGRPGAITYQHIKGLVRGMYVVWSFEPRPDGSVLVTIAHDLTRPPFPVRLLGRKLTQRVVGEGFIGYIAGRTLKRIKELAEGETQSVMDGDAVAVATG